MTDKQRAAMKDIIDSTAVRSALYIKNYCKNHVPCDGCVFNKGLRCIVNVPNPDHWEVDNEILHS